MTPSPLARVSADLVEYVIVAVPGVEALGRVAASLTELVESRFIRILDLVVVARDEAGDVVVHELADVPSMDGLARVVGPTPSLLSIHDLELVSTAVRAGTLGVVVVTEDRWAEPLAAAARDVGGRIVGGERIPHVRAELALAPPDVED